MKKVVLIGLVCLNPVSLVFAADDPVESSVDAHPTEQRFCGVRKPVDTSTGQGEDSFFNMNIFQTHFENNCLFSIGVKGWANTWSLPILLPGEKNYAQDVSVSFKSATEFTAMPTLTLRYKNLYLSANHFFKTDYSFGTQRVDASFLSSRQGITASIDNGDGTISYYSPPEGSAVDIKTPLNLSPSADRSEWDFTFGYYLNEYLALTVGYKKIERNYTYRFKFPSTILTEYEYKIEDGTTKLIGDYTYSFPEGDIKSDSKGSGITIGILGAVPVRGKLSLYGNLVYGWLNTDITTVGQTEGIPPNIVEAIKPLDSQEYDTPYYSGEVGFAYQVAHFKEVGFSFYLGYRFQRYEFEDATYSGQIARDGTDGFIASFSAYF